MKAMYLRKSRAEEIMDSESEVLEKHRRYLTEFAASRRIIIDDVYEEVVSGESIAARPEMQRLLDAVIDENYDAVLCMDIDRLGRGGMQDQGVILDAFRESGTLIITPDKTYDLNNETDEQLTEFKAFMSRQEYKIIRKRMRRGLMQTIEAGRYCATAPFGYRSVTINKKPSLEIVPEEAETVRYIFSRYVEGVGTNTITSELNSLGHRTRSGDPWSISSVRKVLERETYKGAIRWNKARKFKPGQAKYKEQHMEFRPESEWLVYDGIHEAIIPPEVWDKAKAIREGRSASIPRSKGNRLTNPLAGIIVCGKCGGNIQRYAPGVRKSQYLRCLKPGCCVSSNFALVEQHLLDTLSGMLNKLKLEAEKSETPDTSNLQAEIKTIETEIKKLESRKSRLYEFLEDGTYDKATFHARMAEIEARKADLDQCKAEIKKRIEEIEKRDIKQAIQQFQSVLDAYWDSDAKTKNQLLKSILEKVVYSKEKGADASDFSLNVVTSFFIPD